MKPKFFNGNGNIEKVMGLIITVAQTTVTYKDKKEKSW